MKSIGIEFLQPGLVLKENIYNHDGTIILLAAGSALTDKAIEKIKKFNESENNVKVPGKLYEDLMDKGMPMKYNQHYLEDTVGYTRIKEATKEMLDIVKITNEVPYEQVCDIGNLLMERLNITEPALLFQCINGNNEIDEYLYRHSVNVAIINGLMGKWLRLSESEIQNLVLLGIVHDIGKTKVPNEILNSPGRLTPEEFEIVKRHALFSHEILSNNKSFCDSISKSARCHHEKMNGSGYPDGLVADDIPFYARITAISDVYDAMVSQRSYKKAQSPFTVLMQLKTEQFSGLDIRLVNLFFDSMPPELLGKQILLSNGMIGIVRHISDANIEYPIVEIHGEVVVTNKDLYCVCMVIPSDSLKNA